MAGYRVTVRYANAPAPYIDRSCEDASEGMRIFDQYTTEMAELGYTAADQYDDGNGFVQHRYTDWTGNGRAGQTLCLIPDA